MKFLLPQDISQYTFYCDKRRSRVSFDGQCHRCGICEYGKEEAWSDQDRHNCWSQTLLEVLQQGCHDRNCRKLSYTLTCDSCGHDYVVYELFDEFYCKSCDHMHHIPPEEQKARMGEEYEELDMAEYRQLVDGVK